MLEYARWKYILVASVLVFALLFALPNVFGDDRALQIARKDREPVTTEQLAAIQKVLKDNGVTYNRVYLDKGNMMLRFDSDTEQLKARDVVKDERNGLTKTYVNAMSFASRAPRWLQVLGLRAMPLGLDLRGGLYLLYQVDVDGAVAKLLDSYDQDFRRALTNDKIAFVDIGLLTVDDSNIPNGLRVSLPAGANTGAVRDSLKKAQPDIACRDGVVADGAAVDCVMTPQQVRARRDFAITSNIVTLRNRVNTLGVSEPIVQRQGADRIVVQLPGVQNSAEVKDILGKVATLEYRLVDERPVPPNGRAPIGTKIYPHIEGGVNRGSILLKRDIIVTGNQLTNATATTGQNGPEVQITLDSAGGEEMYKTTRANVGKRMGVVFIEQRRETDANGVTHDIKEERVINAATIQGVFGNRFQTTGLSMSEARELSLLLRGGALTAPISIANERTVTATLGEKNIKDGVTALIIGMAALFAFMIIYYHLFGVVADLVLVANVVVLTALLSTVVPTALTLPGIAGIILTVGMAVDANVLIYERIREELRNGVSPQAAIKAGFEKAFSAIADSNVTTFIAGVVLFVFGTGAIKGFAIVLSLGILTSMFTSLMGSRALLTLMFGGNRKVKTLPIG
ncbi:MAG: protein translocase subunit SecD [Pseudomonadota bacterium]